MWEFIGIHLDNESTHLEPQSDCGWNIGRIIKDSEFGESMCGDGIWLE